MAFENDFLSFEKSLPPRSRLNFSLFSSGWSGFEPKLICSFDATLFDLSCSSLLISVVDSFCVVVVLKVVAGFVSKKLAIVVLVEVVEAVDSVDVSAAVVVSVLTSRMILLDMIVSVVNEVVAADDDGDVGDKNVVVVDVAIGVLVEVDMVTNLEDDSSGLGVIFANSTIVCFLTLHCGADPFQKPFD